MSNEIKIPEILMEQSGFCLRIDENNGKMFEHIDYLRQLVTSMHQVYLKLCRRMTALSDDYERRIAGCKNKSAHALTMLTFVKSVNLLHVTINNQLNNNSVTLGTKTHVIAKNRLEILHDKLVTSDSLNRLYVEKVQAYNEKERRFRDRCCYFKDYERDVLKYYSLKENTQLYGTLTGKEIRLKGRLEQIYQLQDEYKVNISEIRVTEKEYFEMEKNIINEYRKLLLNIRRPNVHNNQVYNQPILEESEDNASAILDLPPKTGRSEKFPLDRTITALRKDIIREFERSLQVEQLTEEFVRLMQEEIVTAGERVDEIRSTHEYQHFISQKLVMSEILSLESIRDIDSIVNEISFFRSIVLNLASVFGKLKVLKELKKYRGFNFNKFIEETNPLAEGERKSGSSIDLKAEYKLHQQKFQADHAQHMGSVREKIVELQEDILREYLREDRSYQESRGKKLFRNDLFEKKYFELLIHPFFLSRQQNLNWKENAYLRKFAALLSANQIQNIVTLSGWKQKARTRMGCCGLVHLCEDEGRGQIDDYICSLKDGIMLISGKLNLYANYLSFTSSFNPKTFFGRCDLRIPKWDISQFVKDKHLLSEKVVVETTHGKIQFTSFIHSPYDQLVELYGDRKSGMSFINKDGHGDSELQLLEERFQSQFQGELKREGIIIDKLSTYLTEDRMKLSISLEYHTTNPDIHPLFEIKINQTDISTEYLFIHGDSHNLTDTKARLEAISKQLINRKHDGDVIGKTPRGEAQAEGHSLELEFSMIEQNENNKLSFVKEPSFFNRKSDSLAYIEDAMRSSQGDLAHLLSSRNFLSQGDSEKNNQLQQRLSGVRPQELLSRVSCDSPVRKVTSDRITPQIVEAEIKTTTPQTSTVKARRTSKAPKSIRVVESHNSASEYRLIWWIVGVVFVLNMLLQMVH